MGGLMHPAGVEVILDGVGRASALIRFTRVLIPSSQEKLVVQSALLAAVSAVCATGRRGRAAARFQTQTFPLRAQQRTGQTSTCTRERLHLAEPTWHNLGSIKNQKD